MLGAEVREPVPAEDALGTDDPAVPRGLDGLEAEVGLAAQIAVPNGRRGIAPETAVPRRRHGHSL